MVVQDIRKLAGGEHFAAGAAMQKEYVSFRDIWAFLRRHLMIIALAILCSVILGALFVARTEPTYSAIARLVIDPEQARIASQDANTGTIIIEAAEIASQVEIVKSEAIARAVIKQLNLTHDPEILDSRSWWSILRQWALYIPELFLAPDGAAGGADEPDEEDIMRHTMAGFLSRVSVHRVGQSYVLEIGYTSTDPRKAARTANAIVQAYIKAGTEARSEAATAGASWLEGRLIEIGRQARAASVAVEEFRKKNDITDVGTATSLDQQQIAGISAQLLAAQADTASQSARLATIDRLLSGDVREGYIDEELTNPQTAKLREEMRAAEAKAEALASRYGAASEAVRAAKADVARLEQGVRDELLRIRGATQSNLDIARQREALIGAQLDRATADGADKNLARAELDELDSRATTYRRMYESMLQQLISTLQKQSFPIGDARMVVAATPPLVKAWPKTSLVMLFALVMGAACGIMLAGLREMLDRRIGSGERLGREFGLPLLGNVPSTRFKTIGPALHGQPGRRGGEETASLRYVLDAPYSGFSEALRSVKNAIDSALSGSETSVVGVTSVDPREGKTTIAANLAQLYLNEGVGVALVDANFQHPRLSQLVRGHGAELGLHVVKDPAMRAPAPAPDKRSRTVPRYAERKAASAAQELQLLERPQEHAADTAFDSVPVLTVEQIRHAANPSHRFGHLPSLKREIDKMRPFHQVIIVDLAAFEDSVDTRVASAYVDGIVVVLGNQRKMTVERFASALATYGKARVGIVGVILNGNVGRRRSPIPVPHPLRLRGGRT